MDGIPRNVVVMGSSREIPYIDTPSYDKTKSSSRAQYSDLKAKLKFGFEPFIHKYLKEAYEPYGYIVLWMGDIDKPYYNQFAKLDFEIYAQDDKVMSVADIKTKDDYNAFISPVKQQNIDYPPTFVEIKDRSDNQATFHSMKHRLVKMLAEHKIIKKAFVEKYSSSLIEDYGHQTIPTSKKGTREITRNNSYYILFPVGKIKDVGGATSKLEMYPRAEIFFISQFRDAVFVFQYLPRFYTYDKSNKDETKYLRFVPKGEEGALDDSITLPLTWGALLENPPKQLGQYFKSSSSPVPINQNAMTLAKAYVPVGEDGRPLPLPPIPGMIGGKKREPAEIEAEKKKYIAEIRQFESEATPEAYENELKRQEKEYSGYYETAKGATGKDIRLRELALRKKAFEALKKPIGLKKQMKSLSHKISKGDVIRSDRAEKIKKEAVENIDI